MTIHVPGPLALAPKAAGTVALVYEGQPKEGTP